MMDSKFSKDQIFSLLESALFIRSGPVRPVELGPLFDGCFNQTQIKGFIKELSDRYKKEKNRGIFIEKVLNGYQLRTKPINKNRLSKLTKGRPFRLSGPAMEVLSVIAYRQPCTKQDMEDIRGVECGHILRTLMEKGLVSFAGKSDLPGRPFLYKTTARFLEIFGFSSLKDLPSEEEIREHLPEIPEEPEKWSAAVQDLSVDGRVLVPFSADEKENENLKSILKSIPSNAKFLDETDLDETEPAEDS